MDISKYICHKIPERSFFIRGKQFPVCARCTGIYIGNIVAFVLFWFIIPPWWTVALLSVPILVDGIVQRIGLWHSTNLRRLITGILGGYSISTVAVFIILPLLA